MNNKNLIKTSFGSVFTNFSEEEKKSLQNKNTIAISGKINNPGIITIEEKITLNNIIEKCNGIINNKNFKAAQIGVPFGELITDMDEVINLDENTKQIIILSEEDCIVQCAKFYIEQIINKINHIKENNNSHDLLNIEKEALEILSSVDRISKGRSTMRDIYILRENSEIISQKIGQDNNFIKSIVDKFYKELEEHIEDNICKTLQCSHLAKITITDKCIGCTACTRVCPTDCIIGERKVKHVIDYKRCTHCGQCIGVCPVDAITSGDNTFNFLKDLASEKIVLTQMAPAVRVAIGEEFGFEPGVNVEKKIAAGLRKIGVDYVFDTNYGADLTITEEATELQQRVEKFLNNEEVTLPMLTSCCPAWVKFIEQNYPDMLDFPSSVKSPMQIFAAVAKDVWAKENKIAREDLVSVAIMPCVAKKYESSRAEFSKDLNYDIDYVITTRDLVNIFKNNNIDLATIEDGEIDSVLGEYTGAGAIFGRTGGVIEAATRTAVTKMTGKAPENIDFEQLRGFEGFRSAEVACGDITLKIGIAHGLKEAAIMLDKIRAGEEFYHAIEIMACVGGCVGGGGQPKAKKKLETLKQRAEGLNQIDRNLELRRSDQNPQIIKLYENYLDYPMSHKAHELLHTTYFPKKKK